MIVVDASVAVKWFLKENHSDSAITLLTLNHKLVGPTLALYEVASAFVRAQRRNDIDAELAIQCRERWLHTVRTNVLRLELDNRDVVRASELAVTLGHSLADCVYLAMAVRLEAPFVTADSVFYEKASGSFQQVFHISEVLSIDPSSTVPI